MNKQTKKRLLSNWLRNTYPGVSRDLEKYASKQRTYLQLKADLRKSIKPSEVIPAFAVYRPLYRAVEKICEGHSHLAFIKGRGGLGKSFSIQKVLEESGEAFHEVNSHCSEAYLYRLFYEQNGKVIWFKDINTLLKGLRSMNILKSATELSEKRIIKRNSYSMHEVDLPYEFEFTGKLIFDYNDLGGLKMKQDFEALISRGDFVDLLISHTDICEIMRGIAKTKEQREVTEFLIKNYIHNGLRTINLRTQHKALKTYYYAKAVGLDWKTEIKQELELKVTSVHTMLHNLIGGELVSTSELKKRLLLNGFVSTLKTADRRVSEWLVIGELHRHTQGQRNFKVGIRPKLLKVKVDVQKS